MWTDGVGNGVSYLNPGTVLAGCERVPVRVLQLLPKMGFLDNSRNSEDLQPGTVLEIPFWLAESLNSKRPPLVAIDIPKVYKEAYREILKADASVVDLHKLGTYYYEFGCMLSRFDSEAGLGESLISTFRNRFRHIMDICQNSDPDPVTFAKLDDLEKRLLGAGRGAGEALVNWCNRNDIPLRPAPMVDHHRKRKRVEMEEL